MLPREVLRQIRRLQLKARRAVEDLLGGEYHSVFKGAGVAFEEVREYQPGDDVRDHRLERHRPHGPSVHQALHRGTRADRAAGRRLQRQPPASARRRSRSARSPPSWPPCWPSAPSATTTASAWCSSPTASSASCRRARAPATSCGSSATCCSTSRVAPARRSARASTSSTASSARRAIVFLFSDFLDEGYEMSFKRAGRRHDLIAVRVTDPREEELPAVGLLARRGRGDRRTAAGGYVQPAGARRLPRRGRAAPRGRPPAGPRRPASI